ncbi:hypothetical protein PHISCL_09618 [Aspergillus sclerotialis]|uniref:Uncharacterized protein n=1 Tax=Aspergillus sclerotialis TaxID=2070753 RepID=A0A3A2ZFF3_9EURO|nr:hypothetical protein PHISCL_09618 [Aspergillus sclerotialis]
MELMQKYVKEDGAVGVDNLERWPSDSMAVDFLSTTTSADSVNELKKRSFITNIRWSSGELVWLAWFALYSARKFWSYTPWLDSDE